MIKVKCLLKISGDENTCTKLMHKIKLLIIIKVFQIAVLS